MRRAVLLMTLLLLLTGVALAIPFRARTQAPGGGVPAPGLDPAQFSLGELFEGDAPLDKVDLNALPSQEYQPITSTLALPEGYAVDFKHYPSTATIHQFLDELERDFPTLVETYTLGTSWQGRPIRAIRIANEEAPGDLRDRPAMYIDGQHHPRELISSQVALYTAWWLLDAYGKDMFATHLVDTRVVYVVPSANPDGNDIVLENYQNMRRTANPNCCDDDFNAEGTPAPDGRYDEDYSVGYGYGTHNLYLYHFTPAWADANPENPFQSGWQQNQEKPREYLGRYTGALGGPMNRVPQSDMDGDGLQNEDEIGGVDSNRNYDAHWAGGDPVTWSENYHGPEVWSEPETRAIRDFVLETDRLAAGLAYHSGVDVILHPWGWSREAELPDVATFELMGQKGSQLTEVNGFPGSPHTWTARGLYSATGSTMDWLYESRGVYAFSPEVYAGNGRTRLERLGTTGTYSVGTALGFNFNPRPGDIVATTDRWNRFALYLLAATPNLELNDLEVTDGHLVLTVGNDGLIPVDVTLVAEGVDGASVTGATQRLSAGPGRWQFSLAELKLAGNRLIARAWMPVGTQPHEVELAQWTVSVRDGQAVLEDGLLVPFPDLGAYFGGWWAPEAFDEPGRYHRPPNVPLPVTPPATPTVGPSQTPRPTFTSAPTAPSVTPTATERSRPSGVLLPWLGRAGQR